MTLGLFILSIQPTDAAAIYAFTSEFQHFNMQNVQRCIPDFFCGLNIPKESNVVIQNAKSHLVSGVKPNTLRVLPHRCVNTLKKIIVVKTRSHQAFVGVGLDFWTDKVFWSHKDRRLDRRID